MKLQFASNKPIIGLDLVRAFAIIMVLHSHNFSKDIGLLQDVLVVLGKSGVPLFLLLTGYLNGTKSYEDYFVKSKWKRLREVLIAYIILGSICYFGVRLYCQHPINIIDYLKELFSFHATEYGWYINMLHALIEK